MKYLLGLIILFPVTYSYSQRNKKKEVKYIPVTFTDSLIYFNHKADSLFTLKQYQGASAFADSSLNYLANGKAFFIRGVVKLYTNDTAGYCHDMLKMRRCGLHKVDDKEVPIPYMQLDSFYVDSNNVRVQGNNGFKKVFQETCAFLNYKRTYQKTATGEIYVRIKSDGNAVHEAQELTEQAEPKEGMRAFLTFISQHIMYPAHCKENDIQCKTYVSFIVNADGTLSDFIPRRECHVLLYREAIRVLKLSPIWSPGTIDGNPVKSMFTLPINFKLG